MGNQLDNQQEGTITTWNEAKGFGFIKPKRGGTGVFFHISNVANKSYRPSKNTTVTYTLSYDDQQRPRADNVEFTSTPTYPSLLPAFMSGLFLVILVITTLMLNKPLWIPVVYVVISSITFFVYYFDKTSAMRHEQRVPEIALHALECIGGWPGALIAQYYYRHKIKKFSYLAMYWVLVIVNVGVLIWFYVPTTQTTNVTEASHAPRDGDWLREGPTTQTTNVTGASQTHAWCSHDPAPTNRVDSPVAIVSVDKKQEIVTLKNVSSTTVHLNDWVMCSFRGGQQHPMTGEIQPGETLSFPYTDGNIWSNSETDNGGLYNSAGELVSYWNDH